MHDYNHFILGNRLLRWYNTITMPPWCIHFQIWQRKKREKEREFNSKNTASSRKHYYLLAYLLFFLRTSRQKQKNRGKELEKLLPLYLVYVSHQGRFGQPRTNWRRGRLQKAATTRDRCVVHMCASSVLSRRATSPAPAQRKNCRYFSTWSRWDHEKTSTVFRRSPDRGGIILTSS